MKKGLLISAVLVFILGFGAQAQDSQPKATQPTNVASVEPGSGWMKVKDKDVPKGLKTTLRASKYNGWKKGTLYKNAAGDRYLIKMGSGDQSMDYHFDQAGNPVTNAISGTGGSGGTNTP